MPELLLTAKKEINDGRWFRNNNWLRWVFPRSRWWSRVFGGTVNTSNLISIETKMTNLIDWWSNTNWYGKLGFGKQRYRRQFWIRYLNTPIANPSITNLTLWPGSAPTTGTWLENDETRRGTKGILQTLFSVDGL
jgi:hypothetical protein